MPPFCVYSFIVLFLIVLATVLTVIVFAVNGKCPGRFTTAEEESRLLVHLVNSEPNGFWRARFNPDAVGMETQKKLSDRVNEGIQLSTQLYIVMAEMLNIVRSNGVFHDKYVRHLEELQKVIDEGIPEYFDSRDRWPECNIGRIYDQGGCGSCWAVSASSVLSDRLCIRSGENFRLSAQMLLECCPFCGGCNGSIEPLMPFYWVYKSGAWSEDCYPYTVMSNCGKPCKLETYFRPEGVGECSSKCSNGQRENHRYAEYIYRIGTMNGTKSSIMNSLSRTRENIRHEKGWKSVDDLTLAKAELYRFGPFTLCFQVFEGFLHYYDGVYTYLPGIEKLHLYDHCVRTIGWGKQKTGKEYILAINSWSEDWGSDGTFKLDIQMLQQTRGDMYSAMMSLEN